MSQLSVQPQPQPQPTQLYEISYETDSSRQSDLPPGTYVGEVHYLLAEATDSPLASLETQSIALSTQNGQQPAGKQTGSGAEALSSITGYQDAQHLSNYLIQQPLPASRQTVNEAERAKERRVARIVMMIGCTLLSICALLVGVSLSLAETYEDFVMRSKKTENSTSNSSFIFPDSNEFT